MAFDFDFTEINKRLRNVIEGKPAEKKGMMFPVNDKGEATLRLKINKEQAEYLQKIAEKKNIPPDELLQYLVRMGCLLATNTGDNDDVVYINATPLWLDKKETRLKGK